MAGRIYGNVTRELHVAWQQHADARSDCLQAQHLPSLFNSLHLFPAKSQIHEMLHCASDCSTRPTANHLTFGEFCIFSTELRNCYESRIPRPVPLSKLPDRSGSSCKHIEQQYSKLSMKYEVFLGGSCNPTTWRQDLAIPVLKSLGITYYNPQVSHWAPELIELEYQAKQTAEVLFFVIDNQTRSAASIIEAAHISGCQRKMILVVKKFEGPGQLILGEKLTEGEYRDLNHGQAILQDLVEGQGIPVFSDIRVALACMARVIKEGVSLHELSLADQAQPVHMAHVQLGDKLVKLREAFDALDTHNSGLLGLADVCMAFRIVTNQDLTVDELQNIVTVHSKHESAKGLQDIGVTFDQFCCIVAEYRNKRPDGRQVFQNMLLRTVNALQSVFCPIAKVLVWMLPQRVLRSPTTSTRDVYLGGSCGPSTWREDMAIPLLKKKGLTYFNPQVNRWSERLIPIEAAAVENCSLLLFVITNTCRSLASMALAAHYIGRGCNIVVCIQYLYDDCIIDGEKVSKQAVKDYNRSRMYLSDTANREGIQVFEDVKEAVECAVHRCRTTS